MRFKIILPIFFSIIILSCSSSHDKQKNVTVQNVQKKDTIIPKENFEKGKIIDKVICKKDSSQSYAMYLPRAYSIEKTFPIVIAFDAHGDGKLPVSLYKDLAEQFGYIIVGSNNSKNGTPWGETKQIAGKLFSDVGTRLSMNMQRIYLLGFSGGARVVNGITLDNGSITGVICCGAAAPSMNSSSPRSNYSFMGIIGNEDFNYIEMRKYDMVDLAGHDVKHSLLTFNGKHEWPPKEVMTDAFWWLELNEMRRNKSARTDTNLALISRKLKLQSENLEQHRKKKEAFEAYELCRKTINFYDGLGNLTDFYSAYKSLQSDAAVDKALRAEEAVWRKEEDLKAMYNKAIATENFFWWEKEITSLNKKIKTEKNKDDQLIYKRTLGYLSLLLYMQASGALQQNIIPAAEHFSKVYVLVDPTNSEAHYLMASINAKQGKIKEAINELNAAVKNGFTDEARLQNDNAFNEIKNRKDFEEVREKIKD